MEKIQLEFPVVVEGKYDKIKISSIVSSPVLTLDGFSVFKNSEKLAYIKRLAEKGGLIILTDSDRAGNFIRGRLKGYLKDIKLYNIYIPQTEGKEKRKKTASKDGFIGVEGTENEILTALLSKFILKSGEKYPRIDKTRFYSDGFSGGSGSAEKRKKLAAELGLPLNLTPNALLEAVNLLYGAEEYQTAAEKISAN